MDDVEVDEGARRRFEAAWRAGKPEPVEQHLPPPDAVTYLGTLEELLQIEVELAWKRHGKNGPAHTRPVAIEDYLRRFPILTRSTAALRLVRQEYRARHRYGDQPTPEEYQARFPELFRGAGSKYLLPNVRRKPKN